MVEGSEREAPQGEAEEAPSASDSAAGAAGESLERPLLDEALAWQGDKLDEIDGSSIGRVEGIYVDERSGEPEWLLARLGRFGHYTLVPARDAVGAAGRVWVPYTREQMRGAPRFKRDLDVTKGLEAEYLSHYGIADDAGRAAEIAERPEDSVTARPAS